MRFQKFRLGLDVALLPKFEQIPDQAHNQRRKKIESSPYGASDAECEERNLRKQTGAK